MLHIRQLFSYFVKFSFFQWQFFYLSFVYYLFAFQTDTICISFKRLIHNCIHFDFGTVHSTVKASFFLFIIAGANQETLEKNWSDELEQLTIHQRSDELLEFFSNMLNWNYSRRENSGVLILIEWLVGVFSSCWLLLYFFWLMLALY